MDKKQQKTAGYNDFKKQYNAHKGSAKQRGIEFRLSYDQWLNIWLLSGKINQRGKYVMCRYNDVGSYSVDNVFIDTAANNSTYPIIGHPAVWTKFETDKAVELFLNGGNFYDIAEELKRSYHAVKIKIYRNVSISVWQSLWQKAETKK